MSTDFEDEHRAHIAHEHPVDLNSSPSSLLSDEHTYLHSQPRRGSKAGSSSSHLLARLISREEEVREIKATLVVTSERLEAESSRANAAERRALDYFHRLRIATENRERAEQESARLREELKLYKMQLENAQKEIFRAQDIIDQVASQRNEAEAEAARARTKARKLQEEKLVMIAREEGRRLGYREGLSMGRRVGYDEEINDDEDVQEFGEVTTDEEHIDPRPHTQLRSSASLRQPMRSESAPPVRTHDPTLAPPLPVRVHTPSHEHHPSSPPRYPGGPETIRPIPIRPSPIIPTQPISIPIDDGWIPTVDSHTSQIRMPSPHQLQQPIPPSPSTTPVEPQDRGGTPQQEPTPVPPPARSRDHAYQASAPSIPRGHTPSLASRASTHLSQYDIVNKRPKSSLRNEIFIGRSGSQASRGSASRNEHRNSEHRHSSRTDAENIADQWRSDFDVAPPPRNPPRSYTPSALPHLHRPPNFYQPRGVVMPTLYGDADDSRPRTAVPTEPTATQQHAPDESQPARFRPLVEYHRRRVRPSKRPGSGGSGSIPNIVVESPSEPETTMSPSATTAAQPELLSPEAANRPLPQDDVGQQHAHQHSHSHHAQPPPPSRHHHDHSSSSSSYDVPAPARSGTPYATTPWPAGFVPYPPGYGTSASASASSSSSSGGKENRRRTHSNSTPGPLLSDRTPTPLPGSDGGGGGGGAGAGRRSQGQLSGGGGYVRARHTQSASTSVDRHGAGAAGSYEAAPLPPGVTYPVPPPHQRHRDRDRGWEWDRDRERDRERNRDRARERRRDVRDWDRERERERVRDRDRDRDRDRERRRDPGRDYERERDRDRRREQDVEDMGFDEAPLGRPISLFDSDE